MAEKVQRLRISRQKGFLYYVNKDGYAAVTRAKRGRGDTHPDVGRSKVFDKLANGIPLLPVKKEPGFLYFIDKEGDIARAPLNRKGGKATA